LKKMSLSETELENIIFSMELETCGVDIALQKQRTFTDPIWAKVINAGFEGDLADQIIKRYYSKDYDYTTVEGAVISNIFFEISNLEWVSVKKPDEVGSKDLPLSMLGEISKAKFRPKLPGKMLTKLDVQNMGRRTCYDLVERVGDTLYGIYPYDVQCSCCISYSWKTKKEVQLESWHEGYMVLLNEIEYRVKYYPTIDRLHNGLVWEMQKIHSQWIPLRPREIGKPVQRDATADWQVTIPMLNVDEVGIVPGKRQMSKVVVLGERGPHFIQQKGVWDLVGGKQEINDTTPVSIAQREYLEETGLQPPPLIKIGSYETDHFLIHLFFCMDSRLKGGHDPSLLVQPQRGSWDEFFQMFDPELMTEVKGTDQYRWLFVEFSQTKNADKERSKMFDRINNKQILYSKDDLPFKVDHFLSTGERGYICDHPKYDSIKYLRTIEEITELLSESFLLDAKYGLKVGTSFFAVPIHCKEVHILARSYSRRYEMQTKLETCQGSSTQWFVAWTEGPIGSLRATRFFSLAPDLKIPVGIEEIFGMQEYENHELENILEDSAFHIQVQALNLFGRNVSYSCKEVTDKLLEYGFDRPYPIEDLLRAGYFLEINSHLVLK